MASIEGTSTVLVPRKTGWTNNKSFTCSRDSGLHANQDFV